MTRAATVMLSVACLLPASLFAQPDHLQHERELLSSEGGSTPAGRRGPWRSEPSRQASRGSERRPRRSR